MSSRRLAVLVVAVLLSPIARADGEQLSLDMLSRHAQQDLQQTRTSDQRREQRFLAARDKAQAQWEEVQRLLAQEHRREDALKNEFTSNIGKLEQLSDRLARRSASLSVFFSAVRQAGAEETGVLHDSVISAQYPGRDVISDKLADNTVLPSVAQVEQLWQILLQEAVESGKVVRFQAPVETSGGDVKSLMVTRVGAFDLLANGRYLEYVPNTHKLSFLGKFSTAYAQASDLEGAADGYHLVGIDPSAGAKLGVIMEARDFAAGIAQGHAVGLFSLGFGLVGLLAPFGAGRVRYIRSISAATLFSFGIVILMTNMFKVFFGDFAPPVTYADVQIVHPEIKQDLEKVKQQALPERKPPPEELPVPQRVILRQVDLPPSVPSPLALPKISPNLQMAGQPMIGNLASGTKLMFDNEAIPLVQVPPIYPTRAEMMHLGGMVTVEFTIDGLGRVEKPRIIKSEPRGIFDQAAIQAILNWRFKPKLVGGEAVPRLARQQFNFTPRN